MDVLVLDSAMDVLVLDIAMPEIQMNSQKSQRAQKFGHARFFTNSNRPRRSYARLANLRPT
jgi:hypothetical protein